MRFRSQATAALTLTGALLAVVLALSGGPASAAGEPTVTAAGTASPTPAPSLSSSSPDPITITPALGNYVISAANSTPLISGTVTELAPGATEATPYADQTVALSVAVNGGISLQTASTTSTGGYSFQLTDPVPGETATVEVPASPTNAAAEAPAVTLTAQVLLAAKLSATAIRYGTTVMVTGSVVSYTGGGADTALADEPVQVYSSGGELAVLTQTTADGTFTATLPREAVSLNWTVQTGGGPDLATATATLPMTVNLPTVISSFKAVLSPFWQVHFQGCLGLAPGTPGYVPSLAGLTIQYAASARGPWHTLGTVPTAQPSYVCGDDGRTFAGKLPGQLSNAYYRAVYAGSGGAPSAAAGYLPSVGATVRSWLYIDRITRFTVTPHSVSEGGKLTVSGKLQYHPGKRWLNLARRVVYIILRPKGSSTWYWIVHVTTNAWGNFTATFTDPLSAAWAAEYEGGKDLLAVMSPTIGVTIRT